MNDENFPYLHGFSQKEQDRLRSQAEFCEFAIYQNVNFQDRKNLLEVGCGVGAQTEILLRRFPKLNITGIDLNKAQLKSAQEHLARYPHLNGRYKLQEMAADNLKFEANTFDCAFLCWILEHVPNPAKALSEVRRVLRPGGEIVVTEVMNSSFFLDPYSPHVWKYWMAFNDFQYDRAGDPFIGAKLGNLLTSIGYRSIQTEIKTWHFDNRFPEKRKLFIEFWCELLLSAADALVAQKYVDEETVSKCAQELKTVANDPNAVFLYSFAQARAKVYH